MLKISKTMDLGGYLRSLSILATSVSVSLQSINVNAKNYISYF